MPPSPAKPLQAAGLVLAVAAVAAIGVWAGRQARGPLPVVTPEVPTPALAAGDPLPSVDLLDEQGAPLTTDRALGGRGAVVLLLDLECAPCTNMTAVWADHLASDSLAGVRVFGITHHPLDAIRAYRAEHAVPFPIYADTGAAYVRRHGVNDFPLCVVVDGSGTVRRVTFDPYAEMRAEEIRAWAGR